ncbi:hypothetical protein B7P43_G07303 [Cryptotermes secundus]|uniref:Carbonic anhydrase n=1 Tax=Cryptotermes secundus TaxID=105785 RepID=A0A2J7PSL2_9NEOP|nr:hypothetical protein B7P43_G07303 [Cryptotermes secundus]
MRRIAAKFVPRPFKNDQKQRRVKVCLELREKANEDPTFTGISRIITGDERPSTWAKNYPTAAGSRQSPVDIVTSLATSDTSLDSKPLTWNYVPENTREVVNTGHGWRVDIDGEGSGYLITRNLKIKVKLSLCYESVWGGGCIDPRILGLGIIRRTFGLSERKLEDISVARALLHVLLGCSSKEELVGGPLEDSYRLQQFHCHWGFSSDKGSEHTVDGQSFAGELHLVHWNSSKYRSCGEAAGYPDGLAVLGVLLKVGKENPELQKIVELIPSIYHRGQKIAVKEPIDPASLLPETLSYWTYLGSLTTPPCSECVTWILFKEAIEVSEDQLAAFRSLRCYKPGEACPCDELEGLIINNYRPPLPLGNRELRECGSA